MSRNPATRNDVRGRPESSNVKSFISEVGWIIKYNVLFITQKVIVYLS